MKRKSFLVVSVLSTDNMNSADSEGKQGAEEEIALIARQDKKSSEEAMRGIAKPEREKQLKRERQG